MVQLYIALWNVEAEAYHWALVCSESRPSSKQPLSVFQISDESESKKWETRHNTALILPDNERFLGCVELLPFKEDESVRLEDLTELVQDYGPEAPEGYDHSVRWSSSRWVMCILKDLSEEHGLIDLVVDESFHQRVSARGLTLEWAGQDNEHGIVVVDL
ncbi:hypothetical protein BDN72DRAFT_846718 [Pluteus cervinus]|uniref:Uncharacterized protein n=1 Tax=Pluteus cervinus TaxID=181527 RepID=A0ACD3AFI0_9AGAR|nr:hypothetical protein BDN72DRAFT_846718 [Pluteus cervinus]